MPPGNILREQTDAERGYGEEVFDMVAWDDVEEALKERSKMFRIWYAKQGSEYCGVAYWTSKWGETDKTAKEEELESSRCPSCGMRQKRRTT